MVLFQIVSFVLDIASGLLGGACLLRLFMQWHRFGFANPLGGLVFAFSDWIVLPLRRVVPAMGRWDTSSLAAVFLIECTHQTLLWLMGATFGGSWVPLLAVFGVLRLGLSLLTGLIIVSVVLSWVSPHSPLGPLLARLCEPMLGPLRRVLPQPAGVDLAPLAALVLIQIAAIVLNHILASIGRMPFV